ncbi:UDP-N-acetylmuramoyl-tripeptide--D-alanyl-D-alanine ligase [Jatrophihabitans endophyticus]|uniref:UDP-N-acetylmuramoyl-tripeptide--D-alanyl-D-alanine ligase n=1 Tax=Jatrophihabitans endophyticus TaxID=1206085 RepID=A0A1M5L8S2_9ACTN|nr:UDP-N-acetylmuramoyl-tripeptide--D-alanyl-D-alanine ligase [Jatrophihabitans endophyticus]SHG61492.1 UDP-N-acetylmuramoyl-tripeptide--D-alanyl-D-alanine ligase [Jatrophihabitans endophyticus]
MIELSLGEVAEIVGGGLEHADPATPVTGPVEFDSREIGPGGLFVAFPGDRVDGHDYVGTARERGAVASIVTRPVDGPSIVVADALTALASLAAAVIRRLPDTVVVGVTGSSGKTSTKDLLAQLLAPHGATVAPPGSFNNELGHPYTVLRATPDTRYLVLETSARGIGHIRYLTDIAPPRIGAVLNVGSAHLGEFGSRDAIARAKGELVESLSAAADGGVAVLNADDALVAAMATRTAARVVTVGEAAGADVRATDVELDDLGRPTFTLRHRDLEARVSLRLVGRHHVGNALAAYAVAVECGVAPADVVAGLAAATPASRWRMELTERPDGLLVLNDAYNANPESMHAALSTLARVAAARPGASWAVLGAMAELGDDTAAAHAELGRLAAGLGITRVVAVGNLARPSCDAAVLEGFGRHERDRGERWAAWVPDAEAAVALLRDEVAAGDVVLVKASRSAGLERVALALVAAGETDETTTRGDER